MADLPPSKYRPAPARVWAEVDLDALRANARFARERAGCPVMAVVKAGAYGHGLERIAVALADEGVAFLGVAHAGEARRLADAGIETPLYLLGPTWEEEREEIAVRRWTPCLSSFEEARHFDTLASARARPLRVHLAVDTGMGRGGFLPEDLPAVLEEMTRLPSLEVDGVGTHLASADEDPAFTQAQIVAFRHALKTLGGAERFRWRHLANSAGLLRHECGECNLARPGLILYGVSPFAREADTDLRPVMTLKARVTLVRTLPAGHGISYGRTFVTTHPTRVATIGAGYGDGYPRQITGHGGEVHIRGVRCPLLGRVTMDQIMVDVTGAPLVVVGDEVELFGGNVPVGEVAARADTIPWEILTRITPRVERVYLGG